MDEYVVCRASERQYRVSALISTYSSERFIRGRIENLQSQTIGSHQIEIVVVNSGSPQDEDAIIREFLAGYDNITYIKTPFRETGTAAINRAARTARGKYFAFANADDRCRDDAYLIMAEALDCHPDAGIAFADSVITFRENDTFLETTATRKFAWPDYTLRQLLRSDIFGPQFFWRGSVHARIGYFDEKYPITSDYDFVLKCAWKFGALHIRDDLGLYLRGQHNTEVVNQGKGNQETRSLLRKYRQLIPIEDIYPGLNENRDRSAQAAACADMALTCVLTDAPDYEMALMFCERAAELGGGLQPEIPHNLSVLRHVNAQGANASSPLRRIDHPVIEDAKLGRGVVPRTDGTLRDVTTVVDFPGSRFYIRDWIRTRPLVSIIVPTRNRPHMLVTALDSINNQTYQNYEIVVVNDAGCDVRDIIESRSAPEKIRYVPMECHLERSAIRNAGIRKSEGEYIGYLDDDDLFYPDHIETLLAALYSREYEIAYSDAYCVVQKKIGDEYVTQSRKVLLSRDFDHDAIYVNNSTPNLCLLHRRECLDVVGMFDESLHTHEDWELLIRFSQKYKILHIPVVTAEYTQRTDSTNTTTSRRVDFDRTREIIYNRYRGTIADKPYIQEYQDQALRNSRGELLDILVRLLKSGDPKGALSFFSEAQPHLAHLPEYPKILLWIDQLRNEATPLIVDYAGISEFVETITRYVEMQNLAGALEYYERNRSDFGKRPDLERLDNLMSTLKKG